MRSNHQILSLAALLCLSPTFIQETESFTPTTQHHDVLIRPLRDTISPNRHHHSRSSILSLPMASTSTLYYRDRDESEEIMTDSMSKVSSTPSYDNKRQGVAKAGSDARENGVAMSLISAIWLNQAVILGVSTVLVTLCCLLGGQIDGAPIDVASLHWNAAQDFHSLFDWTMTPTRIVQGVATAVPMIALGTLVEKSDERDACHVNFSTTNMVIGLFGRRRQQQEDPSTTTSSEVMALSSVIALSTGISEEIVFRGYIPTALMGLTHSLPFTFLGQALVFALGHISPRSSAGENKVVGGLQFANAIWYGLMYVMTGGDILPCIIAHVLYDMHVFCETWTTINNQMDYTEAAFRNRLKDTEEVAIQEIQQEAGHSLNSETLNFARRFFYAFDYEHKGSLSLSDVQRAVSYAFLQDKVVPSPSRVEQMFDKIIESRQISHNAYLPSDRLGVSEFLRVLFALKSQAWAN